ncbi:MAG: hypothetical protein ACRD3M_19755, partial [Thermoanaerobaculia bacterium]
ALTTLDQATYLGGLSRDFALALAIHPTSGEVYVAGETYSTYFPGTTGGAQAAYGGGGDAFVARLNAALTTLDQATYLGGLSRDFALALAIHPTSGEVYVAGYTYSTDVPGTTGGAQAACVEASFGWCDDAFVGRLNAALTTLDQATYLGGSNFDAALALAIHPTSGEVYVAGGTYSTDFPGTTGGAQAASGGGVGYKDAFVARLTPDLAALPNLSFFTLTPCRLIDTRTTNPPGLAAGSDRVFTLAGKCGIPASAQALSLNVTVTQPSAGGHIRLYPAGSPRPLVSTVNYAQGQTRAGNAVLKLGNGGTLAVFCGQATGTAHFIVDINGYFE